MLTSLFWNDRYLQHARTSEAPAAEGRDWRAVIFRREALQGFETHCGEGAAHGIHTAFTELPSAPKSCSTIQACCKPCVVVKLIKIYNLFTFCLASFAECWCNLLYLCRGWGSSPGKDAVPLNSDWWEHPGHRTRMHGACGPRGQAGTSIETFPGEYVLTYKGTITFVGYFVVMVTLSCLWHTHFSTMHHWNVLTPLGSPTE